MKAYQIVNDLRAQGIRAMYRPPGHYSGFSNLVLTGTPEEATAIIRNEMRAWLGAGYAPTVVWVQPAGDGTKGVKIQFVMPEASPFATY